MNPAEDLLSRNEIAEKLGVTPNCISRLASDGKIPFYRIGRFNKYNLDEVLEAIKKNPTDDGK
ncbi:MAG: hypothetical protein CMK32_10160 [Porticoccaceae bacterium]|nr:hypothetical protein [Porticoccaceae bacterium]